MGYKKAADGVAKKGKTDCKMPSMGGKTGMKAGGMAKMKKGGMPKMMDGGMPKTKMAYGGAVKKMRSGGSSCK